MTEFTEFRLLGAAKRKPVPRDKARGERIKKARERDGLALTQGQLALKIGVDVGTLSRWERGYPLKPRDVAALSVALDVSAAEIDPDAAKALGEIVPRGTVAIPSVGETVINAYAPTGHIEPGRFSPEAVLKRRDVLSFLYRFKADAIEAGASEDQAETAADLVAQVVRSASVGGAHQDWSVDEALAAMKPEAADHIRTFRKFDRR